jgi:hypothetical protein
LEEEFLEERMLDMIDLLGHSKFDVRSSIILTYSVDLPLYDGLIRRALNRTGVWNQMVFCDFRCFLRENQLHTTGTYAGRHYSITPILQPGAFHPKLYMLLGPRYGRMLIGSGNATIGGLLRNAELFSLFDYEADASSGPHSAFSQAFKLVESLGAHASDTVRNQIKNARQMASWLKLSPVDDGRKVLIGGPGQPNLLNQILAELPGKQVDDLIFCSSSFDRNLSAVKRLALLSKTKPVCIVQPEYAEVDGKEVQKLNGSVTWRPFVDPLPKEKRKRKDCRAHAKLFVFGKGKTETCVFGSANASGQAFSFNTEIVVVLRRKRGETAERLGLTASLKAKSVEKELASKAWQPDQSDSIEGSFPCLLAAVAASQGRYQLTLASGNPPKGSLLAVADHPFNPPLTTNAIRREGNSLIATRIDGAEWARSAWITDRSNKQISNAISITWPEVAIPRGGSGGNSKASQAMLAMQDGSYLGTVLFELLDQFRDFEVIRVGTGPRASELNGRAEESKKGHAEEPAEFFYTDSTAGQIGNKHWNGDRVDLDILASLVQPLTTIGNRVESDEDAYDDSRLEEEAEHRKTTEQKEMAFEDEKPKRNDATSTEKLETAVRRLDRRLVRAADSLESSLAYLNNLGKIAPNGIARQVWMTHIGAFLAGRREKSVEGDEYTCLRSWRFAEYVLRICRSLVGSKKDGGFLDRLDPSAWEGYDGEALVRGLAFLWTSVEWAAGYMVHFYSRLERVEDAPVSIAVGSAELVAARFISKISRHCSAPDNANLVKRFPAWFELSADKREVTSKRLAVIRQLIQTFEDPSSKAKLGDESKAQSLKAGMLVFNSVTGVTMLADDAAPRAYRLVNLSMPGDTPQKFGAMVFPVLFDGKPYRLFQRTDLNSAA